MVVRVTLMFVFVASASSSNNAYKYWQGPFVQMGGGGKWALGRRFTLRGDAAALIPREQYGQTAGLLSIGPFSTNASDDASTAIPSRVGFQSSVTTAPVTN
jgi:hypothetical protein